MKTLAPKLALHVLILCGTGLLLGSYHLVRLRMGGGEAAYGWIFFLFFLEWPLGAFLGGLLSIRILRLRVPWPAYAGYGFGLGVIFYSAAVVTCIGLDANPVGWFIGAVTLPVVSTLIVAAYEREPKLPPQ